MQFNTPNVSEMEYGIEFARLQEAAQTSQPIEVEVSPSGSHVRDPRTPPREEYHPHEPIEEAPAAEEYQPTYGPMPSAQSQGAGDGGDSPTRDEEPVPALYDPNGDTYDYVPNDQQDQSQQLAVYALQYTQQMQDDYYDPDAIHWTIYIRNICDSLWHFNMF